MFIEYTLIITGTFTSSFLLLYIGTTLENIYKMYKFEKIHGNPEEWYNGT